MPELPEVETTVTALRKYVINRTFIDVWSDAVKLVKKPVSFLDFKEKIKGKRIKSIERIGKNIVFYLSGDYFLLVHQKMTGHLLYGKWSLEDGKWAPKTKGPLTEDPMNGFLHLVFFFDNNFQMALSDVRKFSKVELAPTSELQKTSRLLGKDALSISAEEFEKTISKKRGRIKSVLMNQKILAGVGNIYSDEILFLAKVHPLRKANCLKKQETERIFLATKKILRQAIGLRGTSISDYRTPEGEKGAFSEIRQVYRRKGKECPLCKTKIQRVKMGQRSAHFCPHCQI